MIQIGRKLTHNEFLERVFNSNPNIEILEQYKNKRTRIKCRCKIDGYEWSPKAGQLLNGQGCPKCGGVVRDTHKEFEYKFRNQFPDENYIIFLTEYMGYNEKILCYSFVDNDYWWQTPHKLMNNIRNPYTAYERTAKTQSKTQAEHIEECKKIGLEVIGKYKNSNTKILYKCIQCGTVFKAAPKDILSGNTGCPHCRKSISQYEQCVINILDNYNIQNQFQWTKIVYGSNRRYDFYLPKYNIAIEVDGQQHYHSVNWNGKMTDDELQQQIEEQQRIDAEKTRWCIENNIKLIRIPYYWSAEETEEYILNYLKEADYYGKEES